MGCVKADGRDCHRCAAPGKYPGGSLVGAADPGAVRARLADAEARAQVARAEARAAQVARAAAVEQAEEADEQAEAATACATAAEAAADRARAGDHAPPATSITSPARRHGGRTRPPAAGDTDQELADRYAEVAAALLGERPWPAAEPYETPRAAASCCLGHGDHQPAGRGRRQRAW
jgi:hypothetical protein